MRTNGQDTNSGADPANALQHISKAGQLARSNYTIIVGPGRYSESVTLASVGLSADGVRFVADTTGVRTGSPAGPVIVDASGTTLGAGFSLSSTPGSLIDGFTITGGTDAGIVIKRGRGGGSDNFTIQNCIVFSNPGDGIRIQDSAHVTVFNNLVYRNGTLAKPGDGIVIAGNSGGSPDAVVVNNTIYGHFGRGLTVGTTTTASPRAFVHNNILQSNASAPNIDGNIRVYTSPPNTTPRSDVGYDGNFNLVFTPVKYIGVTKGANDINIAARFVGVDNDNYHLQANISPAIDAGDLNLDPNFAIPLRQRTTTGAGLDTGRIDMGFHYPQ